MSIYVKNLSTIYLWGPSALQTHPPSLGEALGRPLQKGAFASLSSSNMDIYHKRTTNRRLILYSQVCIIHWSMSCAQESRSPSPLPEPRSRMLSESAAAAASKEPGPPSYQAATAAGGTAAGAQGAEAPPDPVPIHYDAAVDEQTQAEIASTLQTTLSTLVSDRGGEV